MTFLKECRRAIKIKKAIRLVETSNEVIGEEITMYKECIKMYILRCSYIVITLFIHCLEKGKR